MREEGREEGGKGAGESRVKGERRKREMRGERRTWDKRRIIGSFTRITSVIHVLWA